MLKVFLICIADILHQDWGSLKKVELHSSFSDCRASKVVTWAPCLATKWPATCLSSSRSQTPCWRRWSMRQRSSSPTWVQRGKRREIWSNEVNEICVSTLSRKVDYLFHCLAATPRNTRILSVKERGEGRGCVFRKNRWLDEFQVVVGHPLPYGKIVAEIICLFCFISDREWRRGSRVGGREKAGENLEIWSGLTPICLSF